MRSPSATACFFRPKTRHHLLSFAEVAPQMEAGSRWPNIDAIAARFRVDAAHGPFSLSQRSSLCPLVERFARAVVKRLTS